MGTRVVVYQRCDANELYHQTTFDVKISKDPATPADAIIPSPRLVGGVYCGNSRQLFFTGGTQFTVPCSSTAMAADGQIITETNGIRTLAILQLRTQTGQW